MIIAIILNIKIDLLFNKISWRNEEILRSKFQIAAERLLSDKSNSLCQI